MKKKIFAICLVISMLAVAVVGGSLAWFTAEDHVDNTFVVGSIKIQQNEKDANGNDFVQDQVMLPVVNMENPAQDKNYVQKVVTVSNTGNNDAYVRTHIAIPKNLAGALHLDTKETNWTYEYLSSATVEGIEYVVYTYRYNFSIAKGETTDVLLEGVYLDAKMDVQTRPSNGNLEFCYRENGDLVFTGHVVKDAEGRVYTVKVLVATQAVQADGFASPAEALNSAFGNGTNPIQ